MKNCDYDDPTRDVTDHLILKKSEVTFTGSRKSLLKENNGFKLTLGPNGQEYENLSSLSLPEIVKKTSKLAEIYSDDDLNAKKETKDSSSSESWFKTWPERYDKLRSTDCTPLPSPNEDKPVCVQFDTKCNANEIENVKTTFTLQEALQNISLAYSPLTKQLHFIEKPDSLQENSISNEDKIEIEGIKPKKIGHRRTEAGSFSSTVSTFSAISDASTSGSLISSEDRSLSNLEISNSDTRKKSLTNFLSKHVFSWKGVSTESANFGNNVWKIFSKQNYESVPASSINGVASSSALIQHKRPSSLPAKSIDEEQRHNDEYKQILAAAKKKEVQSTAAKQKQQKLQLKLEEQLAAATRHFSQQVLPNWDAMHSNKKTLDLWWHGLPSSVRGKVWKLAIGNDLNLTQQLYEICLCRAQNRLNSLEPPQNDSEVDQESSMDVIRLDVSRTFPQLCIFQEGGPYSETLHSLLAAYVCYRPDVGYVQGMSYIAAILILNMEPYDAFICFSNLLNKPLHLFAFTLNQSQMQAYYNAYNQLFSYNLPKLYSHFEKSGLTPDFYLLDWIYTIFAKAMPLDIACRVWDVFLRDGQEFIFRTALGILHLHRHNLMDMDFLHGAQFLTKLPDDISSDQLFKSIQLVSTTIGKQTFTQIVEKCVISLSESYS